MKKPIFLLFSFLIFLSACKQSTEPQPPEQKPPGYQEDIPWPSLADSPWPMYRHDPQNSGRSKYKGPLSGNVIDSIPAINLEGGLVLGFNNTLYFSTSAKAVVYSYSNCDSLLWNVQIGYQVITSPLVDKDGNIYVLTDFKLIKLNSNGDKIWEFEKSQETLSAALTMDKNGNIIFIDDNKNIVSVNKNGEENWRYQESRLMKHPYHAPAFSPDGNILYLQGENPSLLAFDIQNQNIKWTFGTSELQSAPMVDSKGNIYILLPNEDKTFLTLYSLDKEGNIRWQANLGKGGSESEEMCIDINGNISVPHSDTLYNFSYDGNLNWKKFLGKDFAAASTIVDVRGNIYVCATSWDTKKIISFDKTGNLLWETHIDNAYILYPPILTNDGKLIVPAFRSENIFVIN